MLWYQNNLSPRTICACHKQSPPSTSDSALIMQRHLCLLQAVLGRWCSQQLPVPGFQGGTWGAKICPLIITLPPWFFVARWNLECMDNASSVLASSPDLLVMRLHLCLPQAVPLDIEGPPSQNLCMHGYCSGICACQKQSPWTLTVPPLNVSAWIMVFYRNKATIMILVNSIDDSRTCFSCDDMSSAANRHLASHTL